ncbi:MAG: phosphoribosylanthranilate isomerase [Terriglobia bacterium]
MQPTAKTRVKICCIGSLEEAFLAIRHGASAVGLVSAMPSGPGVIDDERIASIAARVPPPVASFLLTSRQDAPSIIQQQHQTGAGTLQLCDRLPEGAHASLRRALPGVRLVQVIHVSGPESVDEAVAVAPHADALLLDSGNLQSSVKELGGTGRTHDWDVSRRIREAVDIPVFLAGGLRAENVAEAILRVRPFAVDVCTGVRTGGKLDDEKLSRFFAAVNSSCELTAGPLPP